jgi:hypothetical protein
MRPHPARRGYRQQGNTGSRAAQQQMRPSKSQQSSSRLARAEGAGDSEPWQYYVGAALPGGARREAVLKGGAVLMRGIRRHEICCTYYDPMMKVSLRAVPEVH